MREIGRIASASDDYDDIIIMQCLFIKTWQQ